MQNAGIARPWLIKRREREREREREQLPGVEQTHLLTLIFYPDSIVGLTKLTFLYVYTLREIFLGLN